MPNVPGADVENRVLALIQAPHDARHTELVLREEGISFQNCREIEELLRSAHNGCGAILLAEEFLETERIVELLKYLREQPDWSDLPVILLTGPGENAGNSAFALQHLGNVLLLGRPLRIAGLVSAIRSALRARSRQYELRRTIQELREADRHKDHFLAVLGHELRNPLGSLSMAIELLNGDQPSLEQAQWLKSIVQTSVEQFSRLADDLLNLSRIRSGKLHLQMQPLRLRQVLRAAVDLVLPAASEQRHSLALQDVDIREPDELIILGDEVRLRQAFVNLISNAVKYTDPGGEVRVSVEFQDDLVRVLVCDTGLGIPADRLAHVFEPFAQLEHTIGRSSGGLGIGLALVKQIVQMHGGNIECQSAGLNCGSTFTVILPRTEPLPKPN